VPTTYTTIIAHFTSDGTDAGTHPAFAAERQNTLIHLKTHAPTFSSQRLEQAIDDGYLEYTDASGLTHRATIVADPPRPHDVQLRGHDLQMLTECAAADLVHQTRVRRYYAEFTATGRVRELETLPMQRLLRSGCLAVSVRIARWPDDSVAGHDVFLTQLGRDVLVSSAV